MNGKRAKKLRKQAQYKPSRQVEIKGDYNINLGYRILNVPKSVPVELSDVQKSNKKQYKKLKKTYKTNNS